MAGEPIEITRNNASTSVPGTIEKTGAEGAPIVLLFHGIFVDRSENGRFDRLAPILSEAGYDSLRVDLSGHGANPIPSRDVRIARMCTELLDVIAWSAERYREINIVASSFSGALASIALSSPAELPSIANLIFLNPVLDFDNAFIHAEMPEMKEMFSLDHQREAFSVGFFDATANFQMSREFLLELSVTDVTKAYLSIDQSHLVMHGTSDELISYGHTRTIVERNRAATFESVEGAVHAFTQSGHESLVWNRLLAWLSNS